MVYVHGHFTEIKEQKDGSSGNYCQKNCIKCEDFTQDYCKRGDRFNSSLMK